MLSLSASASSCSAAVANWPGWHVHRAGPPVNGLYGGHPAIYVADCTGILHNANGHKLNVSSNCVNYATLSQHAKYSLEEGNWFSDVIGRMQQLQLECRQRTNFTAPSVCVWVAIQITESEFRA